MALTDTELQKIVQNNNRKQQLKRQLCCLFEILYCHVYREYFKPRWIWADVGWILSSDIHRCQSQRSPTEESANLLSFMQSYAVKAIWVFGTQETQLLGDTADCFVLFTVAFIPTGFIIVSCNGSACVVGSFTLFFCFCLSEDCLSLLLFMFLCLTMIFYFLVFFFSHGGFPCKWFMLSFLSNHHVLDFSMFSQACGA